MQRPGGANQCAQVPDLVDRAEEALHLVGAPDVGWCRGRLAAVPANPCGEALQCLAVPPGKHDVGAGGRKRFGGRVSDATAGSRHHRQPPSEPVRRLSHERWPRS
jgi:hypothetical protein